MKNNKINRKKIFIGACIGNYLEWFDFLIYVYFAAVIGKLFFPAASEAISTMVAFSVFAGGFIMRPLGSLIIGAYGDRHGRKKAMLITISFMAVSSSIFVFAPTYENIGFLAPALIITARLIQGFSTGGEMGAVITLLTESADKRDRGFFVSWQYITQALATMTTAGFAALIFWLFDQGQIYDWAWRIPFIVSLLIIPVGFYIRKNLTETLAENEKYTAPHHPVKEIVIRYPRNFIAAIGMVIPAAAMNYMLLRYTPTYMQTVSNINISLIYTMTMLAAVSQMLGCFTGGLLYDKIEKHNIIMSQKIVPVVSYAVGAILMTLMIFNTGNPVFFFAMLLTAPYFTSISNPIGATISAVSWPTNVRQTAVSVTHATAQTVFGGTTPMIISALMIANNNNPLAPLIWLLPAVSLGLLSYWLFNTKKEKK